MDQLSIETLESCKEYIPKLINGIDKAVNLFQGAKEQEGMELLVHIFEGLQWLTEAISKLKGHGIGSAIALEDLTVHFGELEKAMTYKDHTMIADLFQYEFIPALEKWEKDLTIAS